MSFCIGVCDYLVVIWYDYWCLFGTIRHGLFASLTWNLLRLSISLWNRSKKGIFNTKWSTEKWMYLQMGCKTRYHYHVRRERGVWINRDSQKKGSMNWKEGLMIPLYNDSSYGICFDLHQKMSFAIYEISTVFTLKLKSLWHKIMNFFFSKSPGLMHWNQPWFSVFFSEIKDVKEWIILGNVF